MLFAATESGGTTLRVAARLLAGLVADLTDAERDEVGADGSVDRDC